MFIMEVYKYILLLLFCEAVYVNGNIQCRRQNNKCSCLPTIHGYKFQCPNEKSPNITISVQSKVINIQCMTGVNLRNQDFTFIETNNVNRIVILNCWFATDNFDEIMNIFGINSTELLTVEISVGLPNFTMTNDYFKGLSNLEKLKLHDSNINYFSEDAFKSLNNLIELNIENSNIILNDNMFKYLPKLEVLELTNNNLSYLPSNLFINLMKLKILWLWSNKFTALNRITFNNLQNLELLDLSSNQLKDLPGNTFYELNNLKKISLSMNKLRSIPENLFTKNGLLQFVKLSGNPDLTDLPNNLFANLTKLENLSLHDCAFSQLPTNLLEGSIHLKNILLQRNHIEAIPEGMFNNLSELRNLDLSYNKIKNVSKEVFASLTRLTTLNLENNLLTNIGREYFKSLQDLELLNLKNNKISVIDVHSFQRMVNLKKIILANNYLKTSMGNTLSYNYNLENIDLSNNNITSIDDHFVMKVGLRELDLSYNQISYVQFSNLMTVSFPIQINLKHNNISTVDFDLAEAIARSQGNFYENPEINLNRNVYLDGNPISCDCYLYNFLRYFDRSIDSAVTAAVKIIAGNLTCASPNEFTDFAITKVKPSMIFCTLLQLGIETNCPEKCTCKYRPYDKSLIVNCIEANLTEVPKLNISTRNYFNQLEVYLQGNLLTSGPKEHMGYENVTKLFLSNNNINELTWIPPKIKVLLLNNNNIQHLNDKVLTMLNVSSVTNITLGNNPIICDCSVEKLRTYVISHLLSKKVHLDIDDIKCKNSEEFLAFSNDYCPPYKDILIGFCIPLSLAVFAAVILITFWAKGKKNSFKQKIIIVRH